MEEQIPKNTSQKMFSELSSSNMEQFSRDDYIKIVREKRSNFIHEHFEEPVKEAFEKLKEEAEKMRDCHTEVSFEIPDHFDVHKTTEMIRNYFSDLGYEPILEPVKIGTTTITFTLT